jgi:transcriptional regulator of acetoin/glycerol metabolism
MPNFAVEHVDRVRSVVQSRSGRDRIGAANRITQSWIRCLDEYRLDPATCAEPEVVTAAELQERQERLADVQAVAKVEMANLYQQLAGSGYAIMLTDREGVLLNYFGDPAFTHAASKTGLMPGAVWSERAQGTNGMGTCLFAPSPCTRTNTTCRATSACPALRRRSSTMKANSSAYSTPQANRAWPSSIRWPW